MSEVSLPGKIAMVTGAASNIGLGRAMTLALVRAGARVAMVDIDQKALEESAAVARDVGGPNCVATIVGDVTKADDAERVVHQTITEMGGFHILINNAGINPLITPDPPGPLFAEIPI